MKTAWAAAGSIRCATSRRSCSQWASKIVSGSCSRTISTLPHPGRSNTHLTFNRPARTWSQAADALVDRLAALPLVGSAVLENRGHAKPARVRKRVVDSLLGRAQRELVVDDAAQPLGRRNDGVDEAATSPVTRSGGHKAVELLPALIVAA